MPDPSTYVDEFDELVNAWNANWGESAVEANVVRGEGYDNVFAPARYQFLRDLNELLKKQQEVNIMLLAVIDEQRQALGLPPLSN